MPAQIIHVVIDSAPSHIDLTAWVSAGAAVVQAIAAGAAIIYSGKLAHDAAQREAAANVAAEQRIANAAAAAAEQRRLDAEAAELQREIARVEEHNRPIDQMLYFAETCMHDLTRFRQKMEVSAKLSATEIFWPDEVRGLKLFKDNGLRHLEQAPDALAAIRMRHLYDTFDVFASIGIHPGQWLPVLHAKEVSIETAMDELRSCRLTPPVPL